MLAEKSVAAHVFARLRATWGTRFMALWRGAEMDEVLATWDDALAGVDRDRIARALVDCQNADNPPTLPAFLALCRAQPSVADRQPLLPYVGSVTEREQARRNVARIQSLLAERVLMANRDPLRWARRPRSAQAIRLMARGATTDHRLRSILIGHVDDQGEAIADEGALRELLALADSGWIDRLRGTDAGPERAPGEDDA